jgi:hypothetical protein
MCPKIPFIRSLAVCAAYALLVIERLLNATPEVPEERDELKWRI